MFPAMLDFLEDMRSSCRVNNSAVFAILPDPKPDSSSFISVMWLCEVGVYLPCGTGMRSNLKFDWKSSWSFYNGENLKALGSSWASTKLNSGF